MVVGGLSVEGLLRVEERTPAGAHVRVIGGRVSSGWRAWASPCQVLLGGIFRVATGVSQQLSSKRFLLPQQGYKTLRILQQNEVIGLSSLIDLLFEAHKLLVMTCMLSPSTVEDTACPIRAFAGR